MFRPSPDRPSRPPWTVSPEPWNADEHSLSCAQYFCIGENACKEAFMSLDSPIFRWSSFISSGSGASGFPSPKIPEALQGNDQAKSWWHARGHRIARPVFSPLRRSNRHLRLEGWVWFRRGRLGIVFPAYGIGPHSGRSSTYQSCKDCLCQCCARYLVENIQKVTLPKIFLDHHGPHHLFGLSPA